jgi:hypothetical protein
MDYDEQKVTREFSGFQVSLRDGSRAKKRLSNKLTISVPSERTDVSVAMTIREARALRNFLNEFLR